MDQVRHWNEWYDKQPELWRFPMVLGVLVLIGAINMALTIGSRFPFGLLVLLAILILGAIRVPYLLGSEHRAPEGPGRLDQQSLPGNADWVGHWNHWYESFPELWRFQVIVWALVVVGALNMALTIGGGFPFGLLVLLAIVAIGAVRIPYVMGFTKGLAVRDAEPADAALAPPHLLTSERPTGDPGPSQPATTAPEPAALSSPRVLDGDPALARERIIPDERPPAA